MRSTEKFHGFLRRSASTKKPAKFFKNKSAKFFKNTNANLQLGSVLTLILTNINLLIKDIYKFKSTYTKLSYLLTKCTN